MRALTFSWEYPPVIEGGLARHVRKLSEHLVTEGVEVHVVTRGSDHLAPTEERHGVIVHRVRQPRFPRDVRAFVRWVASMNGAMAALGEALDDELRFDLVHSHDWLVANAAERGAGGRGSPPSTPPSTAVTRVGFRTTRSPTSTSPSVRWCGAPTA